MKKMYRLIIHPKVENWQDYVRDFAVEDDQSIIEIAKNQLEEMLSLLEDKKGNDESFPF